MKKALSLLLILVLLFNCFTLLVSAAEDNSAVESDIFKDSESRGEIQMCRYDVSKKTINISGTVSHDVMVTHKNYKIALYSVPIGESVSDVIASSKRLPIATTEISVKFSFSVKIQANIERFYRYAVVIYDDLGDIRLIGNAVYPDVEPRYSDVVIDKTNYKGITTKLLSSMTDAGVGSSIIPVYIDKLLNKSSSGHLYSINDSYIYFDKEYIGELDAKVKSLSVMGSKVYLQFLIGSTVSDLSVIESFAVGEQSIPNMNDTQTIDTVSAITDFLCDRYSLENDGGVSGIVLSRRIDRSCKDASNLDTYAENYAFYMMVVSNAARISIPDIDVVVPFSDTNSYSVDTSSSTQCAPSVLLEKICSLTEKCFAGELRFSTLIESSSVPYGISEQTIESGRFTTDGYVGINADNTEIYSDYLDTLSYKYANSPKSFIFVWLVPEDISGNVLSAAYSYSYYKMFSNSKLSSFVVSFENSENKGDYSLFPELVRIIKYIDTKDSFSITATPLALLGADSWGAIISGVKQSDFARRNYVSLKEINPLPIDVKGNYSYFDFSYYTNASEWFGGIGCNSIKIDYSNIVGRSLMAYFDGSKKAVGEYFELYCNYEYKENFVYTPYMSINFGITNDNEDKEALYEIKLSYASGETVSEVSRICRAYEETDLLLDISKFSEESMTEYIKISIRCLSEDKGGNTLSLRSMTGHSTEYYNEELAQLIVEEQLRIRNENAADDVANEYNSFFVWGIVLIIVVVTAGIFMCFKRDEDE